jgi:hypothetical protein
VVSRELLYDASERRLAALRIGLDDQRTLVVTTRAVQITSQRERVGQATLVDEEPRFQIRHSLEAGDGCVELATLQQDQAEVMARFHEIRLERDGPKERCSRFFTLPETTQDEAQVRVKDRIFRGEIDGAPKCLECAIIVFLPHREYAEQIPSFGVIRLRGRHGQVRTLRLRESTSAMVRDGLLEERAHARLAQ